MHRDKSPSNRHAGNESSLGVRNCLGRVDWKCKSDYLIMEILRVNLRNSKS